MLGLALLVLIAAPGFTTGTQEPKAAAQPKEVTMLTWSHFVPGYNEELTREVQQWGAEKGVTARVDFLSLPDVTTRLAAEVESQQGHDVVLVWNFSPALYKENLADLDDVAGELQSSYGSWSEGARYLGYVGSHWKAIPWTNQSLLANINAKYWAQAGYTPDQVAKLTWDGLLEAAAKLKAIGHPVGFPITDTFDANGGLYPVLWSFGAKMVDQNGNIAVDSPQTRAALEYVKKLAQYMPEEVYGWNDAGNNRFMLSGNGSWTPNPPSIRPAAVRDNLPVAQELDHVPMPAGPAGRYRVGDFINLGVWKFSKNVDLAKELILYLMSAKNMLAQVNASQGYNIPNLSGYTEVPKWLADHPDLKLRYYFPPEEQIRPSGWPAPPGKEVQIAYNLHVVPIMFAKYVKGEATLDGAIEWAAQQLREIYGK